MKQKNLSRLEQLAMGVVWQKKDCSTKNIQSVLKKGGKTLAYTTVATILQRLYQKNLVERQMRGHAYIYFPKISKETYSKSVAQGFLTKFINSFGDAGLVSFAESIEKLPRNKRRYFLKLLRENE